MIVAELKKHIIWRRQTDAREALTFHRLIQWIITVGVARIDTKVVVCLVLDQRIIPAVADQAANKIDGMRSRDVLCILFEEVVRKQRQVVAAVRLGGEEDVVARILREGAHEALQRLPHVGGRGRRAVGGQRLVEGRVCPAVPFAGVVGTAVVGQLDQQIRRWVEVGRHGCGIAVADLRGLVDEDHVGHIRPGIRVVDGLTVRRDPAWAEFLEQTDHRRRARPAVDPDGQGRLGRVDVASFKEPPEDVLVGAHVRVPGIALDVRVLLADARGHRLVAHRHIGVALLAGQVGGRTDKLRQDLLACIGQRYSYSRQY